MCSLTSIGKYQDAYRLKLEETTPVTTEEMVMEAEKRARKDAAELNALFLRSAANAKVF